MNDTTKERALYNRIETMTQATEIRDKEIKKLSTALAACEKERDALEEDLRREKLRTRLLETECDRLMGERDALAIESLRRDMTLESGIIEPEGQKDT